jgi:hypothetical protein
MRRTRSWLAVLGTVLLLAGVSAAIAIAGPEAIIATIGVQNAYLSVLLLAAIGGLSTLTSTSLFTAIATFSIGGAHPLLLGLFAGVGIFVSDTVFFHVAQYGKASLPQHWEQRLSRLFSWLHTLPPWLSGALVLAWVGFSPLPNDVLMVALAAAGYRYRRVGPLLLAGGICIATLTAYLARAGASLF